MAEKKLSTVQDMAEGVIASNPRYKSSFIEIFPKRLLDRKLKKRGVRFLFETGNIIDKYRFSRQGYLAAMIGISKNYMVSKKYCRELNSVIYGSISEELTDDQKEIIDEIWFIRDLTQEIISLKG
jgi:hypothetical protein